MPKLDRTPASAGPIVEGFTGGGFRSGGEIYHGGLMLTPDQALAWAAPALSDLTEQDLAPLFALQPLPEFVLLGTGATLAQPPLPLIAALDARGIGIEAMDSRAAARTWGLLRSEDRWIAAAFLPFE
jgi:uncharacterized protein